MYKFTKDCMLNIEEIDNEHRRLFQMINEAVAMIEQSDDVTHIANSLISNLKEYASTHFAHEEAYMESIHDPELPLQKKEHKAFTEKVNQFAIDTSSPGAARSSLGEFITFLVRWLYRHILSSDMIIGKMPPAVDTSNDNFAFNEISKIDVKTASGTTVTKTGIIGVIFDRDALGVNNIARKTTSHYNANGDFMNFWHKSDAGYFNDYDENFVVFFVA